MTHKNENFFFQKNVLHAPQLYILHHFLQKKFFHFFDLGDPLEHFFAIFFYID